jgi:hypothetical protein
LSAAMARMLSRISRDNAIKLANAINHATPEQCAEAMTRCTPEAEKWGRRFEDMKEVDRGA